jgi:hypothetical protein
VAQVIKYPTSKHEALSSNPSATKKKKSQLFSLDLYFSHMLGKYSITKLNPQAWIFKNYSLVFQRRQSGFSGAFFVREYKAKDKLVN